MMACVAAGLPTDAVPLRMISAPAVSPDGRAMVFEWLEDLWTAPADGGEAKRIVKHPARDAYPRFSPDGQRIVFSSARSGSLQVYSIPVNGGEAVRHTWQTEGNELECLSPDGTRALVRGVREAPGFLATRLMEIDLTADRRERRLFDAAAGSAKWSPDGKSVLFRRGGEQLYRKGYRGSRASQIWLYRINERTFERMSTGESEDRSPLWLPDGKGFYHVSAKDGTANLWLREIGGEDRQLTRFTDDGVITPEISADGSTILFRRGFGLFRYRPALDRDPVALELWTRETLPDVSTDTRRITGTTSADFTGDLKQVVFSAVGDLWWIPAAGGKSVRLTQTPAAEDEVRFSPDGEWLYFLRDDGIEANYFRARLVGGALKDETRITRGTRSKTRLKPSPDGGKIAWIEGNGDVFTAAVDGSDARCVFKCWDMPTYDWSPDGRWLAIAAEDRNSNRDIRLAAADGSHEPLNLTCHPAFEGSPKWSPDGRWLVFSAKWDASGKSQLWRMDCGKDGPTGGRKAEMISTKGIEPRRVIWSADSKSLFFQSARKSSKKLHQIGVDGNGMREVAGRSGIPIRVTANNELLWRVDRTPEIFTAGEMFRFPISMTVKRPRDEVLTLGFRRIWRTLGERFYDPQMSGRDWNAMRMKYEDAARTARDSKQFDRVISYLRGELNASHLVFTPKPFPEESRKAPREEKTAHPGLVFDDADADPERPLTIARVIPGSPVSELAEPPRAGDTIIRIAGEAVTHGTPLHRFFNGAEKRPLPVVLRGKDGRERVIELRCISYRKTRGLELRNRQSAATARVAAANSGVAWLPVPDMSRETLADLELKIYQASLRSQALILDLRNNGGGREADRMLGMFCQPEHSFTIPRDGPRGYPVSRLPAPSWNKPMVVLCNEGTFSNAEIFCHAIQHRKRAPLVGTATAGGVISAIKTTIPDVGELQVPFRGWYDAATGENFDARGAQPDHPVELTPADEHAGRDPQLEKALELLE